MARSHAEFDAVYLDDRCQARELMGAPLASQSSQFYSRHITANGFMPVKMQLARIIISELTENQVIYLQEVDGTREFPILIGIFEATNIDRRVKEDYEPPRPLTHDLIVEVAQSLGASIDRIVINDLNQSTYFANLVLVRENGEEIEIDSRPSDAIAVAVTFSPPLPIYVAEHVLEEATSKIP
ncbi:bifunctional nuclease family protein [Rubripirellula amarantea]|nr:bifunctional nuclease family protein [Rubripirellula amarantea]